MGLLEFVRSLATQQIFLEKKKYIFEKKILVGLGFAEELIHFYLYLNLFY